MSLNLMVGEVKYSPARDIAYLWPNLLSTVADRLEDEQEPTLHEWLKSQGITMDDLGEAAGAYCKYINLCHSDLDSNMTECLEKSGWFEVKSEARIAYLYYAGALLAGTFFKGIREALPAEGDWKPPVLDELDKAARQFEAYVSAPPWKRWLCRKSKLFRRLFFRIKAVPRPV